MRFRSTVLLTALAIVPASAAAVAAFAILPLCHQPSPPQSNVAPQSSAFVPPRQCRALSLPSGSLVHGWVAQKRLKCNILSVFTMYDVLNI